VPIVRNPWDGAVVGEVPDATVADAVTAIDAAASKCTELESWPRFRRHDVLRGVSNRIEAESESWSELITAESGKPIRDARVEVERAARLFSFAADAARDAEESLIPLDSDPRSADRFAWIRNRPVGVVAAITPFNFPLNLLAHKVAPAVATGCPVVAKPSERTPLTALRLRQTLIEAGWPGAAFPVLVPEDPAPVVATLCRHPAVQLVSYTGSDRHGRTIEALAASKRVVLELGGNAAVAVLPDADLDRAALRCVQGAFGFSGQVCISVQRIALHRTIAGAFLEKFLPLAESLAFGDPSLESTDIGPMIDGRAADRVHTWVEEAVSGGARVLIGGRRLPRNGYAPTVLADTPRKANVWREEVFGPLVVIETLDTIPGMLQFMDDTRYGLQAGVFTRHFDTALHFADRLRVGGLIIDDIPTFRSDTVPYGGERDSGRGREAVRAALDAYRWEQSVIWRREDRTPWD